MKRYVFKLTVSLLTLATLYTGLSAQSLQFTNSKNNGIHVKSSTALNLTTQGSVEAWIYLNSYVNFGGIVHKGDKKDFSDETYTLQLWNNSKLYFDSSIQVQKFRYNLHKILKPIAGII